MMEALLLRRRALLAAGVAAWLLATAGCGGETQVPQDAHAGDTHGDEIHLDADQLKAAGIATVEAAPGTIDETLRLVARVTSNQDTSVHVNPKVGGIVEAIHKGLGDLVEAGEPLADFWSVELGTQISDYLKARSTVEAAEQTLAKTRQLFQQRVDTVTRVLDGAIDVARRILDREKELQEKSISTMRPYLQADQAYQSALLAKDRELTTLTAERDGKLLELDVALRQARIDEAAARANLLVLGLGEDDIERLPEAKENYGRMSIRAPRAGVVMARHITLNEHVDPQTTLFEIHDLSTVWVLAAAYEKDLRLVRRGQKALVTLDALPGAPRAGVVSVIDYRVDEDTRSADVRIALDNDPIEDWPEQYPLRPGMFGAVELVVSSRTGRVVIPERAIVHEGTRSFVFVAEEGEEGTFVRKEVEVRSGARELVEIVAGVDPGERVVVDGVFTLKSMARQGELGGGHSH